MHLPYCMIALVLSLSLFQDVANEDVSGEKFRILFVNDLNYGFFPANELTGEVCADATENKCVAGLARLASKVANVTAGQLDGGKGAKPETIFLNAGNTLGKDKEWFDLMKFQPAIDALNSLKFDAIATGSEVFQYGREAASNFIKSLEGAAVAANVDSSHEKDPPFQGCLTKTKTFSLAGYSVTVIGFLDREGMRGKDTTGLEIHGEIYGIVNTFNNTKPSDKGKSIFVAMGSVKTLKDAQEIARIDGLDILLFSGGNIAEEKYVNGIYVEQISGSNCWLINILPPKTDGFHHILGELIVTKYGDGVTVDATTHDYGKYNRSVDSEIVKVEKSGVELLNSIKTTPLAVSKLSLVGNGICLMEECLLGDLVTDAMMAACDGLNNKSVLAAIWTPSNLSNFEEIAANVNFTEEDVHEALGLPDESIYTFTIEFRRFVDYLENALTSSMRGEAPMLQLSGLFVTYKESSKNKSEVKVVRAPGYDMRLQYMVIEGTGNVTVAAPSHLISGSFDFAATQDTGVTVATALVNYIRKSGPANNMLGLPTLGLRYTVIRDSGGSIFKCMDNTSEAVLLTLAAIVMVGTGGMLVWFVILPRIRARRGSATRLIY